MILPKLWLLKQPQTDTNDHGKICPEIMCNWILFTDCRKQSVKLVKQFRHSHILKLRHTLASHRFSIHISGLGSAGFDGQGKWFFGVQRNGLHHLESIGWVLLYTVEPVKHKNTRGRVFFSAGVLLYLALQQPKTSHNRQSRPPPGPAPQEELKSSGPSICGRHNALLTLFT